jgi:hypothetical protein
MLDGTNINWSNCWRGTFLLLLLGGFFGCIGWVELGKFFGIVGGIAFIVMFVVRFDDFKDFMDQNSK